MTNLPGYWKRLIKCGVLHELGQQPDQQSKEAQSLDVSAACREERQSHGSQTRPSKLRFLYDGTHCPSCLREFHVPYTKCSTTSTDVRGVQVCFTEQRPAANPGSMGSADYKTIENKTKSWNIMWG